MDFNGGFPLFGYLDPFQTASSTLPVGSSRRKVGPPSLDYSATGPPSYDRYRQHCSSFLYFHKQGRTHSHALLCLVVVFYSMASISPVTVNQPITTKRSLHPEIVPGLFGMWDTPTVDMLTTVYNNPLYQFRFPISKPLVLAIGFVSKIGEAGVCFHPFFNPLYQFRFPISKPLVLAIGFVSKIGEAGVCFHPFFPLFLTSPLRPTLTTGICLKQHVIPSAHM